MEWKFQDMNHVTAREVARRAAFHMRLRDMYMALPPIEKAESIGPQIVVEHHPLSEQRSICFAHNYDTGAVQVAVNGMSVFQACILCDTFAHFCNRTLGEIKGATADGS
jgi:hypothetical protein